MSTCDVIYALEKCAELGKSIVQDLDVIESYDLRHTREDACNVRDTVLVAIKDIRRIERSKEGDICVHRRARHRRDVSQRIRYGREKAACL